MQVYQANIQTVSSQFKTSEKSGLTSREATSHRKKYGDNVLQEKPLPSKFLLMWHQLASPLILVLLLALAASIAIQEIHDAIVIGLTVFINVALGFMQEWNAEKTAHSLRTYEVDSCTVRRNGQVATIPARQLVPGDVVLLGAGTKIPADLRLFYVADFSVDESLLTGESAAVAKQTNPLPSESTVAEQTNMAFAGTYALSGKAEGFVVATGNSTELGKIANLVFSTTKTRTPLQQQLNKLSWFLGWAMIGISAVVFLLGIMRHIPYRDMFMTAVALAVAAIPEGLLIALTVVLAIGMQRILKRRGLVRHLVAAETLGSVSVICTDKTGTLTKRHMAAANVVTPARTITNINELTPTDDVKNLFTAAVLNNDATFSGKEQIGLPMEIGLLESAATVGLEYEAIRATLPRTAEIPFSSDRKYMVTMHQGEGGAKIIVKGALEKILPMSSITPIEKSRFEDEELRMVEQGLRVLAFAESNNTQSALNSITNLTLLGLIGLEDPLRPQAVQTVHKLAAAGIKVVLVTGDHAQTALHVASHVGLQTKDEEIITGAMLDAMSDDELFARTPTAKVFARVDPKDKIRIVQAWKKQGATVAMIGDGVNDAPALKAADIGVSLGSGAQVAHEISDMVLLDNNLSTIVAAVHEGRIIFENIRKIVAYLLANGIIETLLIAGALIANLPLPVVATQILWINIINHSIPYMALTLEHGSPSIMRQKPRPANEPILNRTIGYFTLVLGIIPTIGIFGLFLWLLHTNAPLAYIRTMIFSAITIDSLLYVFSVRNLHEMLSLKDLVANKWLIVASGVGILLQLAAVYIPPLNKLFDSVALCFADWGLIIGLAIVQVLIIEIMKKAPFLRGASR